MSVAAIIGGLSTAWEPVTMFRCPVCRDRATLSPVGGPWTCACGPGGPHMPVDAEPVTVNVRRARCPRCAGVRGCDECNGAGWVLERQEAAGAGLHAA